MFFFEEASLFFLIIGLALELIIMLSLYHRFH